MKLQKLISGLQYAVIRTPQPIENVRISKIVYHSHDVVPGALFVCVKGSANDGHAYVETACRRGAVVVVVEKLVFNGKMLPFPEGVTVLLVKDTREALARMGAVYFEHPARHLKVIGVTGTKGKTTVTWMIYRMLKEAGRRVGLIGTIEHIVGEKRIPAGNTTPESFTIQEYFAKMVEAGCEYAVMEVSSQGIKQKRIEGIPFEVGVFTNFGEDHVGPGEHSCMGEYRYYKSLLFRQCRIGIGNLDDIQCSYMFRRTLCDKYGFTCQKNRKNKRILCAERIRFEKGPATTFYVNGIKYVLGMPGMFNVYNALAALQTIQSLGLDIRTMKSVLAAMQVRGRMERIFMGENIACYIDYAHNAMSLQNVLSTLRCYQPERILLVFGCGGNRTKSRRLEMGETAGRLAHLTFLTSDNPRFEEPEQIIHDIEEGMKKTRGSYRIIMDRREAVRAAVEEAKCGDVVLIAGKGHEDYQEIRGVKFPMDDRELVAEAMNGKREKNKDG